MLHWTWIYITMFLRLNPNTIRNAEALNLQHSSQSYTPWHTLSVQYIPLHRWTPSQQSLPFPYRTTDVHRRVRGTRRLEETHWCSHHVFYELFCNIASSSSEMYNHPGGSKQLIISLLYPQSIPSPRNCNSWRSDRKGSSSILAKSPLQPMIPPMTTNKCYVDVEFSRLEVLFCGTCRSRARWCWGEENTEPHDETLVAATQPIFGSNLRTLLLEMPLLVSRHIPLRSPFIITSIYPLCFVAC